MEYFQYFRLDGPPFQPASPRGAVYLSPTHMEGLATLEKGLTSDLSGLTLLTGEAGTGKTTLIYSLLQRDYKRVRVAHIDDPKLSFLEMMQVVMSQLQLYAAGTTKLDYLNAIDHLLDLHGKEERIAIVVDEAQVLTDDTLEELRLVSNRGQREDRCLQLVLVGQPELAERLKKPELRQLNQRISSRGVLKPLTPAQAIMYVESKLIAQNGTVAGIFEPRALPHLLKKSDGIPRKINMLCHTAMNAAFYANERKVSVATAKKTALEYHDSVAIVRRQPSRKRLWLIPPMAVGAGVGALLLLGEVYPNGASEWVREHTIALGKAKRVEQADDQNPLDFGVKPIAPAALAPQSVESGTAPRSPIAGPMSVPGIHLDPTAPAAAAVSASNQPGASAGTQQGRQITVRPGDTLETIAIRYYGSKDGISDLIAANPQITDINQLSVGQTINLPASPEPRAVHVQTTVDSVE
jgi:type II secretory pathway predicted ATPase ExeA/LysM repeat protein